MKSAHVWMMVMKLGKGMGLKLQCCDLIRFKIYILVSVMIYLIQRRHFVFCIVLQSALQLESLPALVWSNRVSARNKYSVSSECCIKTKQKAT